MTYYEISERGDGFQPLALNYLNSRKNKDYRLIMSRLAAWQRHSNRTILWSRSGVGARVSWYLSCRPEWRHLLLLIRTMCLWWSVYSLRRQNLDSPALASAHTLSKLVVISSGIREIIRPSEHRQALTAA